jgi:ABC-type branched-subunit amino acid transport system permease subunit
MTGILTGAAGLIVLAYAISSAIGLWLAAHAMRAAALGLPPDPPLSEAPAHHRAMLIDYAAGNRGRAWRVSFACLVVCLVGLLMGSPIAAWAFGVALAIDCWLFLSYPNRQAFLAAVTPGERAFDIVQCVALLIAFAVLFWS